MPVPKRKLRPYPDNALVPPVEDDWIMNREEIADLYGCSLRQVFRMEELGFLPPALKIGLRRRGHWKSVVLSCMGHPTLGPQGPLPGHGRAAAAAE